MSHLRRALGVVALAVALLQGTAVGAAAVLYARADSGDTGDCCAKGSHAPGHCPLHRPRTGHAAGPSRECRLSCAATTQGAVTSLVNIPPVTAVSVTIPLVSPTTLAAAEMTTLRQTTDPNSPPPKSL